MKRSEVFVHARIKRRYVRLYVGVGFLQLIVALQAMVPRLPPQPNKRLLKTKKTNWSWALGD